MNCPNCKTPLDDGSQFCYNCGKPVLQSQTTPPVQPTGFTGRTPPQTSPAPPPPRQALVYPRNPPLSPHLCWVNLLLPGVAQIIHGQSLKGMVIIFAYLISYALLPVLGAVVIIVLSIVDAYQLGKVLQAGRSVGQWQWFTS